MGDSTFFNEAGFLGRSDLRGIGYVEPQGLPGVETGDTALVAAILLKGDEGQIAWELGLTRVTTLIGMKYRHYPCPVWSDLRREPVATLLEMNKSLLGQIARVGVRASYYEENGTIFLRLRPGSRERIQGFVSQLPPEQPFALRTQPDPRANACLVWHPGKERTMAITPPNSDGSRKTGAFVAFASTQNFNEIRSIEDGFLFLLTDGDWRKIRQALRSASDVFISPGEASSASISIQWVTPKVYVSPVTGESCVAENWMTYEPQCAPSFSRKRRAVSLIKAVLLTEDRVVEARIAVKDLADYVDQIQDAVDAFFSHQGQRIKRDLTIHLALMPQDHNVSFVTVPTLDDDQGVQLDNQLEDVAAPKVGGSVKLELILNVWDTASRQQSERC